MQAVQALSRQCTMVLIAHRLRTIQACDRVVMLDGGVIVADGEYDDLMKNSDAFRRLAGLGQLEQQNDSAATSIPLSSPNSQH